MLLLVVEVGVVGVFVGEEGGGDDKKVQNSAHNLVVSRVLGDFDLIFCLVFCFLFGFFGFEFC